MTPNRTPIDKLISAANGILLGKENKIKLALCAMFADGHLLINDQPGVGKTTLANLLARLFGLDFQRIQFTSDLLPADITGVSIFDSKTARFEFHPGPVFTQLLLADEINRATPKTQSALLEAMEEKQVSVEGHPHKLPHPFFVIATQNPGEQAGTFVLPESQLDRFLLSIDIGYPDHNAERQMLTHRDPKAKLAELEPVVSSTDLLQIQNAASQVYCSDPLLDYLQAIISFSRENPRFHGGYSPRAAMGLLRAARAWALIHKRESVLPEDLQAVIPSTLHHLRGASGSIDINADLLDQVAIP